ncbi:hypothetical protein [Jatrophihabitans endophyticus]|uniref:hypothetical protein n=1 Tax=Jatrophihabitans endophyticus TaxID=1206085 RepID=UPI0019F7F846|nr:hypothetical protein [Jatrophihabitans endophyticus]MBE7186958.1 hypothetical protein [Jatrophihabitans endophyticus]
MQPAVPEPPRDEWYHATDGGADEPGIDVGAFEQGTEFSRWALARYIVGRVILERVSWGLLGIAVLLLVLGAAAGWGLHSTALTVVCVLLALTVLALRAVLRAVLRRLMAFQTFAPVEDRIRSIVGGAGDDIFAELRRVGLPSHTLTLPLLVPRLIGRRRPDTMQRIRAFRVEQAVPRARRDELYLVLRQASGGRLA